MTKIAFIGAGNMAEAIWKGMLESGSFKKSDIILIEASSERREKLKTAYPLAVYSPEEDIPFQDINVLLLAVKPQSFIEVAKAFFPRISNSSLVISILAGTKLNQIEKALIEANIKDYSLCRVMPNLGALVGESLSAFSFLTPPEAENRKLVESIFSSVGQILAVNEAMMDSVTALSGSGPAYIFYFLEALIESGEDLGFSKEDSELLAFQTMVGALKVLKKTKEAPQSLRAKVTSKGGTTEAALRSMMESGFKDLVKKALNKAKDRSIELGQ